MPPFRRSERTGTFMRMCNFKYKGKFKPIADEGVNLTMKEIYDRGLLNRVTLTTFELDLKNPQNAEPMSEHDFQKNSEATLLDPFCKLLRVALGKSFDITSEKPINIQSNNKSTPITKVDLALYVNGTDEVYSYSCAEFKQFPVSPEFYGPNETFNVRSLFIDEKNKFDDH